MRSRRVTALTAALLLAASCGAPSRSDTAAAPAFGVTLPFVTLGDLVVDERHERVFVTSGPDDFEMVAYDFEGRVVRHWARLAGPSSVVLHDDDIYVFLPNFGQVLRLDRASLEKERAYEIHYPANRYHLAWASGRLWHSAADTCEEEVRLASLRPGDGRTRTYSLLLDGRINSYPTCAHVAAEDSHPESVYVWPDYSYELRRYDVSGTPVLAASRALEHEVSDLAVDDRYVYIPGFRPASIEAYTWDNLAPVRTYEAPDRTAAVAVSRDGAEVAALTADPPVVTVFDVDSGEELGQYFVEPDGDPVTGAFEFHPDGDAFFVVVRRDDYRLRLVTVPRA